MDTFSISSLLKHKVIVYAIAAIVVITVLSGVYFYFGIQKPAEVMLPGNTLGSGDITANGAIEPVENPDLSFQSGGRVAYVPVNVGDHVYAGQVLASLDTASLSAQRASAQANVNAQQAKLDELKSGPRDTDKAVRQAAVDQAIQAQNASYAALPSALSDAYAKSSDAIHLQTDTVFANPNTINPALMFTTTNSDAANAAVSGRITVGAELSAWNSELSKLSPSATPVELDTAISSALVHLPVIRNFEDTLSAALTMSTPSATFSASQILSAQSSVSAARTNVNNLITSLTALKQTLVSESIAINSAKASLAQLVAGASSQDIAVQQASLDAALASLRNIEALTAQNLIIARFPGTVGSVSIKAGELASPNAPAITILPDSALEVQVYVTEIDVTRLSAGDTAEVTLDAYGSKRVFPAHVSVVDQTPTNQQGVPAYKVALSFDAPDASVKTGMTANATIHPGTASQNTSH